MRRLLLLLLIAAMAVVLGGCDMVAVPQLNACAAACGEFGVLEVRVDRCTCQPLCPSSSLPPEWRAGR